MLFNLQSLSATIAGAYTILRSFAGASEHCFDKLDGSANPSVPSTQTITIEDVLRSVINPILDTSSAAFAAPETDSFS
jgi:hypothetical protein